MNLGDILLGEFPFFDGSGAKVRPVVVVSARRFNLRDDIVVVPVTSRLLNDPFVVLLPNNDPDFAITKLKQSSAVKWSKPFTISKRLVVRRLGILPQSKLDEVLTNLVSMFAAAPMV